MIHFILIVYVIYVIIQLFNEGDDLTEMAWYGPEKYKEMKAKGISTKIPKGFWRNK